MRRLWRWLVPAAATVAAAVVLAWSLTARQISEEISASVAARIGPSAQWAAIVVNGRDVDLHGTVMDPVSYGRVLGALARVPGVRRIRDLAFVPPLKTPFNFTASRTNSGIELSGFVPSQQIRARLLDAVGYFGLPIVDSTAIARGGSEDFEPIAFFAIAQLAALSEGTVFVSDREVSIRGLSANRGSYNRLMATLTGPVPGNGRVAGIDVAPPLARPFGWRADISPLGLQISGHRHLSDSDTAIQERVNSVAPGLPIQITLLPARGAPPGFSDAVAFALEQVMQLRHGAIAVVDQEISAKGTAKDAHSYRELRQAFEQGLPGGYTLVFAEISLPEIAPYTWSAELDDNFVVIKGFVPSPEARQLVLAAAGAALPGRIVHDRMELATGVPPGFADLTEFALERLAALSSGRVDLVNSDLSVRGVAADAKAYRASIDALQRQAPAGGAVVAYEVTPPAISPYVLNIAYNGAEIVASGYVPSARARLSVRDALAAGFPSISVHDRTDIGHGAPEGFAERMEFAIAQLARLQSGMIALVDTEISIRGLARTPTDYALIRAALADRSDDKLDGGNIEPPSIRPFDWQLAVSGREAQLTGHLPSVAARERILAAVRETLAPSRPNLRIRDEGLIAAGAPDGFESMAQFAIDQLAQMSEGAAGLSDNVLTLAGVAADPERFGTILDAVAMEKKRGSNTALGEIDVSGIRPPTIAPYQWRARKDASDVTVAGFVPDQQTREFVISRVRRAIPDANLEDSQRWGDGAPDGYVDRVTFVVGLLSRLKEGEVILTEGEIVISGVAASPKDYAELAADLEKRMPQDMSLVDNAVEPASVSPFVWALEVGESGYRTTGFLPDELVRQAVSKQLLTGYQADDDTGPGLIDNALIAAGAPEEFSDHAVFAATLGKDLRTGKVTLTDNRLSLTGAARSPDRMDALDEALASPPAGLTIGNAMIEPATVEAYSFAAQVDKGRVTLTGYAQSRAQRELLASLAGPEAQNSLAVAAGAPSRFEWRRAAPFAVELAGYLDSGTVSLSPDGLSLNGRARNPDTHRMLVDALDGVLPPGLPVVSSDVAPPVVDPYEVSLRPVGSGLVLEGFAPDEATREIITDMAELRFSGQTIAGELRIAAGEPRNFLNAINVGLQAASRLKNGAMFLSGSELRITGDALYNTAESEIAGYIRETLSPEYSGILQIGVLGEPTTVNENKCLEEIKAELVQGRILFESALAAIREESFGLLDRIVYHALRCPEARFQIGGHTDADGAEEFNKRLSLERAQAVKAYLVEAGMKEDLLVAAGFGESFPVADNETEQGKALNRRITFELLPPQKADADDRGASAGHAADSPATRADATVADEPTDESADLSLERSTTDAETRQGGETGAKSLSPAHGSESDG